MGFVMVKRFVILSVRSCYRSVCKHPFLVGMAFLLIFMYRSFPLLFSLFVSASPVIVSTAVLLATLLSFGHPNIPEIEKEETTTTTHHHLSLQSTGFGESDSIIVSKDRGFDEETERYYTEKEKQKDSGDEVVESSVMHKDESSNVDVHVSEYSVADGGASVTKENSIQQGTEEAVGESVGRGFEHEIGDYLDKESPLSQVMSNHYSQIQHSDGDEESSDMDKDKIPEGSVGDLETRGSSPWTRVDQGADDADADDDDDDDEEASDSGSDGAESSSPDASMADIIPMLDELHPLLDEEHPQTALMSHDGSDAASEHSLASSHNTESDDDVVNHEGLEVEEDEEEEEETHADKEDETKSAITWTEDDQKNLMNLGTSELERNQRLENLIARRRARKNMRLMAEKNLIDLESADLPFSIAPISTARNNPFDLPYDSNDNIPGSAPSILLPRRNPFDLPYDSSEEKPDLAGDTFQLQQDFVSFHQPKEPFFRRHESFNVGPSIFGAPRQERQEYKLRPYFIPERMAVEGTSYSSFQRQSSELSDSKMSSVPDTESNGSAGDLEDMKVTEEDLSQEPELISVADHVSHLVGHGSQSSEDVESVELGQVESRDVELDGIEVRLGDFEDHQEVDSSLSEPESEATPRELHINEIHLKTEGLEHKHSSRSSSSSSSEINEENAIENEGEVVLEQTRNSYPHTDPSISVQPLTETPQFDFTSLMAEENQHKEPVYDSSPPSVKTNPTFFTDLQVEASQMGLHSVPENEENSFVELEFGVSNQGLEKENPDIEEESLNSAERNKVDDTDFTSRSLTDVSKHDTQGQLPSSLDEDLHQHLLAAEKVSSIELRDKEVNLQFEQVHEVADEKLVSTYQSISDEESASQFVKELSLLATSMDESSSEHPKKELVEFDDKASRINMDPSEFQETYDKVPPNNNFSSTLHLESTETEAPPISADLQDVEAGNPDLVQDLEEHWNFSSQLTESQFDGPNNIEDVEEIDENLLRELDTVGDFSINDVNGMEKHMLTDGGSFVEESFGAFNDSSTEVFETKVKVDEEDQLTSRRSEDHTGVSEPQISPKDTESSDIESNVQVTVGAAVTDQGGAESSSDEDSSSRVFDVKGDKGKSSKSSTHSHDSGDELPVIQEETR